MDTDKKVALHFGGDKRLLPRQGSSFFPELAELCTRAGLHGSVSFVILHNYTDLQSREGLHVHTPQVNGVSVSWHSSDKEAVRVLLNGHNGLNKRELHELLLKACVTTKEGKVPKPPETTAEVLAKILGEEDSSQGSETQEVHVETEPEEAAPPAEPEVKPPLLSFAYTPSQTTKFFDDSRNIGLFLLEMAVQANSEGELSTTDCVAILRANFGFLSVEYSDTKRRYEYNEPYGVLGRLVSQELLAKSPKLYRLTEKARELLGEEKVEPPAEPEKPAEVAPETPTQLVSTMLDKLTALAQRVESAKAKRARLCELDARQVEIIAQQRALEIELGQVVAEMQPLVTELQDRRVKDDEAAYAAVEMLFKE